MSKLRDLIREVRLVINWWSWYRAPSTWSPEHYTNVATENYLIRALRKDAMDLLLARENFIAELRGRVQIIAERRAQALSTVSDEDDLLELIWTKRFPR